MCELMVSKNETSELRSRIEKYQDSVKVKNALENITIPSESIEAMKAQQDGTCKYNMGAILGTLKAFNDTLPEEIAAMQRINNVPLDMLIKVKIDQIVTEQRKKNRPMEMTSETSYMAKYRRLSEMICGYGYNMYFIEDRFKEFFPRVHTIVLGFAEAYSEYFHKLASVMGIQTVTTSPKTQDIWKNWMYFLDSKTTKYSLEGTYLYMYHGGWNCSGNPNIPYKDNQKVVNKGTYAMMRGRNPEEFEKAQFDFTF